MLKLQRMWKLPILTRVFSIKNENKTIASKYFSSHENSQSHNYPDVLKYFFNKSVKDKKLPCFEVYSSQIEILHQPMDFYLAILKLIRSAKQRICISSLYLGTGKMEEFLVEELLKALRKKPELKITILLDFGRGLRQEHGRTSLDMLDRLLLKFLPGVFGEIQGVLHSKLLIFDNYTIITGANLSHTYFTNRQDRYYVIQECEPFADYCEDYINSLANVSYTTSLTGELIKPAHIPHPFNSKVEYTNTLLQQFKMFKFDNRVKIPAGEELTMEDYFENLEKYNNNYRYRPDFANLIEFSKEKKEFLKMLVDENKDNTNNVAFLINEEKNNNQEEESYDSFDKNSLPMKPNYNNKVLIFPSFQINNINQLDDQEILKDLFSEKNNFFSKIRFTSGYLNLEDFLIDCFNKSSYEVEVITSAPKANSFYNAGFFKKNIPHFYRRYEQILLQKLSHNTNFSLFEFQRENWSFHSKGFWLYGNEDREYPTMTIIGSSNYNSRSFKRDVESQFYLYSYCQNFRKKLHLEAEDNFSDSQKVKLEDIKRDKDVKIKLKHKLLAKYLRKYL